MTNITRFITKLRKARKVIENGWTQDAMAIDDSGQTVPSDAPNVAAMCLLGALYRAGFEKEDWAFYDVHGERASTVSWNDAPGRTKEEVLACIDNSIAALHSS